MHFAYFYVLWLAILTAVKAGPALGADAGAWLASLRAGVRVAHSEPVVHLRAAAVLRRDQARARGPHPHWALWLAAAAVQSFPLHTGWEAIDDYAAHYYVFFLTGYMLAPKVFQLAEWARNNAEKAVHVVLAWAIFNGLVAFEPSGLEGYATIAEVPVLRIGLGLIGAIAVVIIASLLSKFHFASLIRYAGRNSIVLYVSFVLPMAATRIVLLKTGLITDIGVVSLIVTAAAVAVPLALHAALRNTWARFLYERPERFKIERRVRTDAVQLSRSRPAKVPDPESSHTIHRLS